MTAEHWFYQEAKSFFILAFQIIWYIFLQFTCSSIDETSTVLKVKFCKSAEFSEITEDVFTRLTDWEEVEDNKLSSWLKVITDNDSNTKICCEKMNCICER